MKFAIFLTLGLLMAPAAFGQEAISEMKLEKQSDDPYADYKVRLVPQLGMSSMGYTGKLKGDNGQDLSFGLTTEVGETKARLLEAGFMLIQTKSKAPIGPQGTDQTISTSQLGIPLLAKLRFIDTKSQAWYFKVGAITTFQTNSNQSKTSSFDVLGSVGLGARVPLDRKLDLLLEATFNRGIMNAFLDETSVQEGVLVFTGISIAL